MQCWGFQLAKVGQEETFFGLFSCFIGEWGIPG